jgi:hypothetical protein
MESRIRHRQYLLLQLDQYKEVLPVRRGSEFRIDVSIHLNHTAWQGEDLDFQSHPHFPMMPKKEILLGDWFLLEH